MTRQVDGQGVPTGKAAQRRRPVETASTGPVDKDERRTQVPAAVFFVVQSGCLRQTYSRLASQRSTIIPAAAPCPTDVATWR